MSGNRAGVEELADRVHSVAIRILRTLRTEDEATGLSAPRLSALSVLVFRGPMTVGELARAEQVRPPSISRLLTEMERQGLVRRHTPTDDRRVREVRATARGRRLLQEGRQRRVARLAEALDGLAAPERVKLSEAVALLEGLELDDPSRPA